MSDRVQKQSESGLQFCKEQNVKELSVTSDFKYMPLMDALVRKVIKARPCIIAGVAEKSVVNPYASWQVDVGQINGVGLNP